MRIETPIQNALLTACNNSDGTRRRAAIKTRSMPTLLLVAGSPKIAVSGLSLFSRYAVIRSEINLNLKFLFNF